MMLFITTVQNLTVILPSQLLWCSPSGAVFVATWLIFINYGKAFSQSARSVRRQAINMMSCVQPACLPLVSIPMVFYCRYFVWRYAKPWWYGSHPAHLLRAMFSSYVLNSLLVYILKWRRFQICNCCYIKSSWVLERVYRLVVKFWDGKILCWCLSSSHWSPVVWNQTCEIKRQSDFS